MYPVMPELVRFWMQERQDEAREDRLGRLANIHRRSGASIRSLADRFGAAAARPTTSTACTCPETC